MRPGQLAGTIFDVELTRQQIHDPTLYSVVTSLYIFFLMAWEPFDIETAYRILESFHRSLHRLGETDYAPAKLLLRPARLRIDSFFTQAAPLIRAQGVRQIGGELVLPLMR